LKIDAVLALEKANFGYCGYPIRYEIGRLVLLWLYSKDINQAGEQASPPVQRLDFPRQPVRKKESEAVVS